MSLVQSVDDLNLRTKVDLCKQEGIHQQVPFGLELELELELSLGPWVCHSALQILGFPSFQP